MTVANDTTVSGPFTLNGVTTTFGYSFRILDSDELEFVKFATSDGTLSVLTPDSVTGVGEAAGGNCVFNSAPSGGVGWVRRKSAFTQPLNITNYGPFFATSVMAALDRLQMQIHEVREEGLRALRGSIGEEWDALLPAAHRESKVVTFDESGDLDLSISRVDVSTVAGISAEIEALGALETELQGLYAIRANITTVAGISSAVSSLSAIAAAVSTCASNITAIQNATTSATDAATSASDASDSAAAAATSETNAASSASAASSSASAASTSASSASTSASSASTSASAASTAQTAAEAARDSARLANAGAAWNFSTTTTASDPGSGNIRFNNSTLASVTAIYVSETDAYGASVSAMLATFDDSTSATRAYLLFRKKTAPADFVMFAISAALTDNGTWDTFTVSHVTSNGSFSNADELSLAVWRVGDQGPTGPGSGDVTGPASSVSANITTFSGTTGKVIQDSGKAFSTDGTLAGNSDALVPTQKAVKTYADLRAPLASPALTGTPTAPTASPGTNSTQIATTAYADAAASAIIAAADAMVFKGATDCSANPNYPAGNRGDTYRVSVAGKIGGASGTVVEVGDLFICNTDSTSSGNQATVGSSWNVIQTNIAGAVTGPASSVDNRVAFFNGTTGKVIKDSGLTLSGSNTGDQTITLTGDVTGSGTGSFAATIAATFLSGKTEDTAPDAANDMVLSYDNSATALKKVKHLNIKPTECIRIDVSDESTAITTGTAKVTFRMPYAFTVTDVRASVNTVSSSGNPTFDINEGGTSILGANKLSIDASEKTSTTAATPTSISDTSLADDAEITIDIDTAGTGAKGAKVLLIGYRS